ncbi:MAG TPA: hypothetical protein VLH40_08980 [Atribacteraceae bacterium]|nr:hypothetical protein [Atribacteraceae bacterium]
MTIVIFANSPGEIASWVKPAVEHIVKALPRIRLIIVTPPCQWRSGGESLFCTALPNVVRIIEPWEYLRYLIRPGSLPELRRLSPRSVILYFGGELFYPLVLQRRTGVPLVGYRQDAHYSAKRFQRLFVSTPRVRDRLITQGSDGNKIEVAGNLMIDGCPPPSPHWRQQFDPPGQQLIVSLFPGSRKNEIRYMLPFFLKTVDSLKPAQQAVRFFLSLSPFAGLSDLERALASSTGSEPSPKTRILTTEHPFPVIKTPQGQSIEIVQKHPHEIMAASDLMLTIPGTKTLEAAFYGTPMLVVTPLERAEDINIGGLVDFLSYLPLFGKRLKRKLIQKAVRRFPFTALPNIIAGESVVPELVGKITPDLVAREVEHILHNPGYRDTMRKKLPRIPGPGGAALRIAEYCAELLSQ